MTRSAHTALSALSLSTLLLVGWFYCRGFAVLAGLAAALTR